jgi:hypothetical protein
MKKILLLITLGCLALSTPYGIGNEPEQPLRIELGKKPKKVKCAQGKHVGKKHKKERQVTKSVPNAGMYHPYYYIKAIGSGGRTLSTYDESVWEISPYSAYVVNRWGIDTPIIIKLNHRWFSGYDYCLYNAVTNESVAADLSLGPFAQNALLITGINAYLDKITISNNSTWTYGYWDTNWGTFKNWKVGQAVLIGETDNWLSPHYILINLNESNYIPVNIG